MTLVPLACFVYFDDCQQNSCQPHSDDQALLNMPPPFVPSLSWLVLSPSLRVFKKLDLCLWIKSPLASDKLLRIDSKHYPCYEALLGICNADWFRRATLRRCCHTHSQGVSHPEQHINQELVYNQVSTNSSFPPLLLLPLSSLLLSLLHAQHLHQTLHWTRSQSVLTSLDIICLSTPTTPTSSVRLST